MNFINIIRIIVIVVIIIFGLFIIYKFLKNRMNKSKKKDEHEYSKDEIKKCGDSLIHSISTMPEPCDEHSVDQGKDLRKRGRFEFEKIKSEGPRSQAPKPVKEELSGGCVNDQKEENEKEEELNISVLQNRVEEDEEDKEDLKDEEEDLKDDSNDENYEDPNEQDYELVENENENTTFDTKIDVDDLSPRTYQDDISLINNSEVENEQRSRFDIPLVGDQSEEVELSENMEQMSSTIQKDSILDHISVQDNDVMDHNSKINSISIDHKIDKSIASKVEDSIGKPKIPDNEEINSPTVNRIDLSDINQSINMFSNIMTPTENKNESKKDEESKSEGNEVRSKPLIQQNEAEMCLKNEDLHEGIEQKNEDLHEGIEQDEQDDEESIELKTEDLHSQDEQSEQNDEESIELKTEESHEGIEQDEQDDEESIELKGEESHEGIEQNEEPQSQDEPNEEPQSQPQSSSSESQPQSSSSESQPSQPSIPLILTDYI